MHIENNLEFYKQGFGIFAVHNINRNIDIRISLLIAQVNRYCRDQLEESIFWHDIRNIFSLKQHEESKKQLKKRILTDLSNVCFSSNINREGSYFYKPAHLGLKQITFIHACSRVYYENNTWSQVQLRLEEKREVAGNINEIYALNKPGLFELAENQKQIIDLFLKSAETNIADETNLIQIYDIAQKIDSWIINNKKTFPIITMLKIFEEDSSNLPTEISNFTGLNHLNCWIGNGSNEFIKKLKTLTNLTYINLEKNALLRFPPFFCNFSKLKSINLSGNQISEIPSEIKNLTKLKHLTLTDNEFKSINESVCSLKLTTLNLKKNPICKNDLPKNINVKNLYIKEPSKTIDLTLTPALTNLIEQRMFEIRQQQIFQQQQSLPQQQIFQQQIFQQQIFQQQIFHQQQPFSQQQIFQQQPFPQQQIFQQQPFPQQQIFQQQQPFLQQQIFQQQQPFPQQQIFQQQKPLPQQHFQPIDLDQPKINKLQFSFENKELPEKSVEDYFSSSTTEEYSEDFLESIVNNKRTYSSDEDNEFVLKRKKYM